METPTEIPRFFLAMSCQETFT